MKKYDIDVIGSFFNVTITLPMKNIKEYTSLPLENVKIYYQGKEIKKSIYELNEEIKRGLKL